MRYHGRNLDPVAFWSQWVDWPTSFNPPQVDQLRVVKDYFSPKVVCPNPDHNTHKRHFQVNLKRPFVHCFANCGISGSYEHALSVIQGGITFDQARAFILRETDLRSVVKTDGGEHSASAEGGELELDCHRDIRSYDSGAYSWLSAAAQEYLAKRGISPASIGRWGIGFDEAVDRIVIPARSHEGALRFLIRRKLTRGEPKYLYSQGYPKTWLLFGGCYLDAALVRSEGLVLVEGSLDSIVMHQHGLTNTVGILGDTLSTKQSRIIDRLRPRRVFLFFDKDNGGMIATKSAADKLIKYPIFICRYPKHRSDPGEMTKDEVHRAIERSISYRMFLDKARQVRGGAYVA